MRYSIESKKSVVEVYGTPKSDPSGIKVGQEMWIIARHIWGNNSRYVVYENVSGIATKSIKIKFITNNIIENQRRAKLLISVWKYAYKNIPLTTSFFPERESEKKINEDYDSIILEAATLYKNYHKKNIKESTSGLRMLNRALNQEPNTKLLSKPKEKDKAEKLIDRMLKEDVRLIKTISHILEKELFVREKTFIESKGIDRDSIGGIDKANKSIRRVIKKEFLKRYKITK